MNCEAVNKGPSVGHLPQLWYENGDGERWVPGLLGADAQPPGFVYQHSRFANELQTVVLGIDSVGNSARLGAGSMSYIAALVLAMTRPTWRERMRQLLRSHRWQKTLSHAQAVLHAAVSCEGCMNVLLYEYGTLDGYARGSEGHVRARTSCELCTPRTYR